MAVAETYNLTQTAEQDFEIHNSPILFGPLAEAEHVSNGLDFYKATMSQFVYEKECDAEVTFTFKNRGEQTLKDYIDPGQLQARFDDIAKRGFSKTELDELAKINNSNGDRLFSQEYIDYIAGSELPLIKIEVNDDIEISTTGPWPLVTFWETVAMSEVNEAYFEGYIRAQGIDLMELYDEGDRRLSEKIAYLQENPGVKIAEFGTRRRFSLRWQKHVIERLKNECPENLVGTSNIALASTEGLKPIGTFAHELPMVYAGLAEARGKSIRGSHGQMLDDWYEMYGDDLSIALTDTFGADFFFEDFGHERAEVWRGGRHDSGDPIEYGNKTIKFYEDNSIDPTEKTVVFSDGLNMSKVERIHKCFDGWLGHMFGIGTDFTNDLGIKPLNVVMKATEVNGVGTVKLSDTPGKHTGSPEQIRRYQNVFRTNAAIEQ
jgi:nicotinate phosphoribosyltransferase